MAKKDDDFGRNEMAALLGGSALLENLTKKPEPFAGKRQPHSIQGKDKEDVSDLTVAQTAALLKEKDLEKKLQSRSAPGRLRAQKRNHVPQHHTLLIEEQHRLDQKRSNLESKKDYSSNDESESEDGLQGEGDFVSGARNRKGRKKLEPQIVVRRAKSEPQVISARRRRRERYSSSDESSSDESSKARKGESSSSSEDDRRERVLEKRRHRLENQKKVLRVREEEKKSEGRNMSVKEQIEPSPKQKDKTNDRRPMRNSSSDSDTSKESNVSLGNSSSGSSSSSSEDSSSDDDDCAPVIAKPLFVPRHKRQTVLSQQQRQNQESEKAAKLQEQDESRKMQSRLMVAQAVAANSSSRDDSFDGADEGGGATNAMPDDTDPNDPIELEKLRDEWEVREIQRLLESQDLRESKAEELVEYERRRNMTDQERIREDRALGLYQKPGEQRQSGDSGKDRHYLQRYYHRGAFYMDEEEWDAKDVRHKAKEYERAVTGNDKIDKRNLPKVMQVKNFGFARQNTRYKGLSHEDTTDKEVQYLPLKHNNKKRR